MYALLTPERVTSVIPLTAGTDFFSAIMPHKFLNDLSAMNMKVRDINL